MNPFCRLKAAFQGLRGARYLDRGDPEKALQCLDAALSARPGDSRNVIQYALALTEAREHEKALGLLDTFQDKVKSPQAACIKAQILLDLQRHEEALKAIERALSLDESNRLARSYHALLSLYLGREKEEALAGLKSTLPLAGSALGGRFLLFCSEGLKGEGEVFPSALSRVQVVNEILGTELPEASPGKTSFSLRLSRALRLALSAVIRAPFPRRKSLYALHVNAGFEFSGGNPEDARNLYRDILALAPDDMEAAFSLVLADFLTGADTSARTGLKTPPLSGKAGKWPVLAQTAAVVAFHLGHFEEALEYLEPGKTRGDMDYLSDYYAGLCYLNLGAERQQVLSHFISAVQKNGEIATRAFASLSKFLSG